MIKVRSVGERKAVPTLKEVTFFFSFNKHSEATLTSNKEKATVTVCNMMLMEVLGFRWYEWLISINRIVTSNNNTVQDLQNMWFVLLLLVKGWKILVWAFFFLYLLISPNSKVVFCRCNDHPIIFLFHLTVFSFIMIEESNSDHSVVEKSVHWAPSVRTVFWGTCG